jgi:hypothetical protein
VQVDLKAVRERKRGMIMELQEVPAHLRVIGWGIPPRIILYLRGQAFRERSEPPASRRENP